MRRRPFGSPKASEPTSDGELGSVDGALETYDNKKLTDKYISQKSACARRLDGPAQRRTAFFGGHCGALRASGEVSSERPHVGARRDEESFLTLRLLGAY